MKLVLSSVIIFVILLLETHSARAQEPIRVIYSSINPHASLVWIAEKRGLFKKYGLSSVLVYVPGGSTAIQALVSGDVDLAQLTGPPGVSANLRGGDILYIAMSDDRMAYQLVTRRDIKRSSELKGRRFGISRFGSSSEFGLRTMLKTVGINAKDVSILQIATKRSAWRLSRAAPSMVRFLTLRLAPKPNASTSISLPTPARWEFLISTRASAAAPE